MGNGKRPQLALVHSMNLDVTQGQYLVLYGHTLNLRDNLQPLLVTSGQILVSRGNIRSLPVYFWSHPSPQGHYPVTSGQVPVPLDKLVIFTVTSGL